MLSLTVDPKLVISEEIQNRTFPSAFLYVGACATEVTLCLQPDFHFGVYARALLLCISACWLKVAGRL